MKYIQVLDALDFGDAVSNQVINLHHMLLMRGEDSQIFSKYANHRVQHYRQPFEDLNVNEDVVLIHHFAGYSEIADEVIRLRCYKIFAYHNVTPHTFFEEGTFIYNFCRKGRSQLRTILPHYNLSLGASLYNCRELEALGFKHCRELSIAVPSVSHENVCLESVAHLRQKSEKIWLFLGRIARNKRQDLLVEVFSHYMKRYPNENHHLYLVGRYDEEDSFYQTILSKINALNLENHITLSGKVEDELLSAYYQAADIFVCLSQHEGFCVPIVEAFNHQLPVVAYAGTAIEGTLGPSYGALKELDIELAAQKIHEVLSDTVLQDQLKQHGLQQAARFSFESVQAQLYSALDELVVPSADELSRVSVIICTCNHRDALERCLNYLEDQDYPHFEVIVVHGPSVDDTMSLLNDRLNIKLIQNPTTNLSISQNLGIEQAAGEIVAFIDEHTLPYSNWLTEIVQRYHELPSTIVGVGGRTFLADHVEFEFEEGAIDSLGNPMPLNGTESGTESGINSADFYRYLSIPNATFRRDALLLIQGFDECDDFSLAEIDLAVRLQQAGGLLSTAPNAYVRHEYVRHEYIKTHSPSGKRRLSFLKKIMLENAPFLGDAIRHYQRRSNRKLRPLASQAHSSFLPYLGTLSDADSYVPSPLAKFHILIVSQEFPPHSFGGIGAYNHTLAKELIQFGHEVTVISRGSQDSTETIGLLTHIQVATVKHENAWPEYPILSKNLAWARTVRQIVERLHLQRPISIIESALWDFETIDILNHQPLLNIPLVTRLVTPLQVAIDINGWTMNPDFQACIEVEKILVDHTDAVVPISQSIQKSFQVTYGFTPDDRWSVQMLGVQPWPSHPIAQAYEALPSLQRRDIQILFMGRLEARKGIDLFLKALKTLFIEDDDRIGVWIAGRDVEGWQRRSTSLLGPAICDRIHFFGVITEELRGQLYENCDFVVFPSRYESFGLVPLEAMVYQKPVIAAAAGAIPEVVIDGESGLLFEPDNEQDLARKIMLLINDEPLRKKLAQGAKQRVEVLSARKMAQSSLWLYESLIGRNATIQNSRVRVDRQTTQSPHPQRFQCEMLDEFERIVTKRELQLGESPIETTELPPLTTMKSSLEPSPVNNLRSDWDVTRPRIIGWGFLNGIANRFIVPKIAMLINSVLHPSMQMQSSLNRTLISENIQLKNNLNQMTADLSKLTVELAQLIESTQKIAALQEDANRIHHDSFQEMKTIMETTRIQMILESEVIRSEFSYQSKTIPEPVIVDSDRWGANTGDLRLNLGCGMQIMEGYINIDERKLPGVDLVADVGKLPFEKASVTEIYAAHLVEHVLEFDLKQHILPYWHDLLKADGKLVIVCPDAEHMILEYTKNNFHWDSLRKVTYGAQDYGGNFHYNMFTAESLSKILSDCGFRDLSCEKARLVNGFYEMQINAYK